MTLSPFPDELVVHIASYLHPSADLNFALSSKQLLRCSQERLAHHRKCSQVLRGGVRSTPDLSQADYLAAAFRDPIIAWHLREATLDAYLGEREDFRWEEDPSLQELRPSPEVLKLIRPGSGADLGARTRAFVRKHFYMSDDDIKVWTPSWSEDNETQGFYRPATQEAVNRAVLLALCPRMSKVICTQYIEQDGEWPLNFMSQGVKTIYEKPERVWPEGFQALRSLEIGVRLEHRHNQDMYDYESHALAPFFVLPGLESLWVDGVASLIEWPGDAFVAPPGSSPLRSLHLHWVDLPVGELKLLFQSATSLRSAVFEHCYIKGTIELVRFMGDVQGHSLVELRMPGSLPLLHMKEEGLLEKFKKLRVIE
ncbi:hypothetical protein F4778DRAFT_235238 [Xylariomycetidae sp. FL2044]|nr:hypothetical protein F4778DRAFT_235238 [Xylariomycetidae sp. FL2044]